MSNIPGLFLSKRFWTAILGAVVIGLNEAGVVGFEDIDVSAIVTLVVAIIAAFTVRDPGSILGGK